MRENGREEVGREVVVGGEGERRGWGRGGGERAGTESPTLLSNFSPTLPFSVQESPE